MERVTLVIISLQDAITLIKGYDFTESTEQTMLGQVEEIAMSSIPTSHGKLFVGVCAALGVKDGEWLLVND